MIDYQYNGPGAATKRGDLNFTYDSHQRPIQVRRFDRLIAEYVYNPFGERVKKVVYDRQGTGTVTYFLFDGSSLSAQTDGDGQLIDQYVYLEDHRPVARLSAREIQAIHTDHRGAPRLVTDSATRVIWQASYSPFGAATVEIEEINLPHRLPGQQLDVETGLHYNYYRHYDPSTGRYTTSDPLGLIAGYNTYNYVGGNPLSATDPSGLIIFNPVSVGDAMSSLRLGLYFLDTAGATGALARFLVGVAAVGASPVVIGGTVVAVAALAVHFARNGNNEAEFTQDIGGVKPSPEHFEALRAELARYDLDRSRELDWEGSDSWDDFFWLQGILLTTQSRYVDDHAECDEDDHPLLSEAARAVEAAGAAVDAAQRATEKAAENLAKCVEAADKIKKVLFSNKRDPNSGNVQGYHGYLARLLEQICGASPPDTAGWLDHERLLDDQRKELARNMEVLNGNECLLGDHLSEEEQNMIEDIRNPNSNWHPQNTPHLGRDHFFCEDAESLVRQASGGRIVSRIQRIFNEF